jgi:3-hydroxyisobutyrate dehydrogenase-like beta-hydroxyacid dehydrogenase
MATVGFIGFGELGATLAGALAGPGGHDVHAWSRPRADSEAAAALTARIEAAGATQAGSLEAVLDGADLVLSVLPGSASEELAERALALLPAGACFADLATAPPEAKERAAARAAEREVLYVDGAVLGTVAASGPELPVAAAGSGAERLRELTAATGMAVEPIGADAGTAARLKLVRSVYMKGRDALVLETMLAARRLGVEDAVARSIAGPGEQVPFTELSERVLRALAVHAGRRAEELASSAALVRELGIDPLLSEAGAERLRRLAELGLRERFGGERPADGRATLDAADERGS